MSDARTIAAKLEGYLGAGYLAVAIKDIHSLINYDVFLEEKVAALKAIIVRMEAEKGGHQ